MPYAAKDVKRHNKRVASAGGKAKKTWVKVANSASKTYGDKGKAIATANKVAGKVLAGEALLLRGPDYGAFGLVEVDGGVVTYDHNLDATDKRKVIAVLENTARPVAVEDGGTFWQFSAKSHPAVIMSNVQRAIRLAGYSDDALGERAILSVSEVVAMSPDLPAESRFNVLNEAIEAGLRRHVEVAVAALAEHGRVTPPTVRFFSRPNALDGLGRPLPFVIARAFVEGGRDVVEMAVREALAPVREHLVRATATQYSADEPLTVDIALAPTASMCEAYAEATVPVFEATGICGGRTVWIKLDTPLDEEAADDIGKLCAVSTAAIGMRTEREGRAVVAQIPSSNSGPHVGDTAFQERVAWLVGVLDPWGAEVYDVGVQETIAVGAPSSPERIQESDADIRRAERNAATGDPAAIARLQALTARLHVGEFIKEEPVPSYLDADALRDLELFIDNTGSLYPMKRSIERQLLRKIKANVYKLDLAARAWMYLVDAGAKEYSRGVGGSTSLTFPKPLRSFLAMRYARDFGRRFYYGEVEETFQPTAGMERAAFGIHTAVRACKKCDLGIPKYRGRYPTNCPRCGARGSVVKVGESYLSSKPPFVRKGGAEPQMAKPAENSVIRTGTATTYDELLQTLKDRRKEIEDRQKTASRATVEKQAIDAED